MARYSVKTAPSLLRTKGKSPFSRRVGATAALAVTVRVMGVRATAALVPMDLQVADQADLTAADPMAALAVSGADPVGLLPAAPMVDQVVVPADRAVLMDLMAAVPVIVDLMVLMAVGPVDSDPAAPVVLVAAAKDVVNVLVSPADAGELSSGWTRLIASSTKSSVRLSR